MTKEYTLVRTNRRTLALVIRQSGALEVRAPLRMPLRDIEAFIAQKQRWILEKQAKAQGRVPQVLMDGSEVPFLGQTLTLHQADVPSAFVSHGELLLPQDGPLPKGLAVWLRKQAEALIQPRVAALEKALGLYATSLSFSTAKTRWGSMNSAGAMRLNLALLFCPTEVIDYVIVHELIHRRHLNHSPAFWQCVAQAMPDYQEKKAWLKQNHHLLEWL